MRKNGIVVTAAAVALAAGLLGAPAQVASAASAKPCRFGRRAGRA
ncbi:hypothetical protein AB5J62_39215 [Amycolatopsis sp. cg5]